jgi:hypothetical protein
MLHGRKVCLLGKQLQQRLQQPTAAALAATNSSSTDGRLSSSSKQQQAASTERMRIVFAETTSAYSVEEDTVCSVLWIRI